MKKSLIVLPDGTEISSGDSRGNAIISCTLTESANSGTELTLGSACSSEISISLFCPSGNLGISAGEDIAYYTISDDGEREKIGVFTAEEPTISRYAKYRIIAYDHVSWLDKDMGDWISSLNGWPYTLKEFAKMVCSECGLKLVTEDIPNGDYLVKAFSASWVTGRQLVKWCAEACGRFVRATKNGDIEFAWYEKTDISITPGGDAWFYADSLSYSDYTVSPIEKVQIQENSNDVGTIYPDIEENKNAYKITGNYLLTADSAQELKPVCRTIYEQLQGVAYTPCKIIVPESIMVKCGDIISITDRHGTKINAYIMQKTTSGHRCTLECTGSASRDSVSAVNEQSFKALNGKVLNLEKSVDGLRIENKDTAGKVSALELNVDNVKVEVSETKKFAESAQAAAAKNAKDLNDYASTVSGSLKNLQDQIDGAIETWFYDYQPTDKNAPAVSWTTTEDKNKHLGDLFYIVDNDELGGQVYRWALVNGVYTWAVVEDTEVAKALETAAQAKDTADGKRRVFVSQPVPPYDVGDLWTDGADLRVCKTARASGNYTASDWSLATDYIDSAEAQAKADTAEKNAKEYTTAQINIAADRITSNVKSTYTTKEEFKKAVVSVVDQYYKSSSATALVGGEWANTQPEWADGTYIWNRRLVTYGDGTTGYEPSERGVCITGNTGAKGDKGDTGATGATGSPGKDGADGKDGAPGAAGAPGKDGSDGVGIKSIAEYYQVSSSNSTAPTTWATSPPVLTATNKYLWNYETITYTDGSTVNTAKRVIGVYGDKGDTGSKGDTGAAGKSIGSIINYYLATASASGVTTSTSGWTTDVQSVTAAKKYLWNYEVIKYTDGTVASTSAPCIIGAYGDKGATGAKGDTGATGAKGDKGDTGATGAAGKDGSDFTWNLIPNSAKLDGKQVALNATDANTESFAVTAGEKITVGFDVKATAAQSANTALLQYFSSSGERIGYEWVAGAVTTSYTRLTKTVTIPANAVKMSIGLRSTSTYANTYRQIKAERGTKATTWAPHPDDLEGAQGATGVGIKSITEYYQVSTSNTTAPSSWVTTVPTLTATNKYLWNYEVIAYTNGTTASTAKRVIGVYGDKGATGATGATGAKGDKGDKGDTGATGAKGDKGDTGATGAAGRGIKSTAITYQAGASGTTVPTGTWSTTVPATSAAMPYLWQRTILTYTDGTTSTAYSIGGTVEGVAVGGRNLIVGASKYRAASPAATTTASDAYSYLADTSVQLEKDKVYTLQAVCDLPWSTAHGSPTGDNKGTIWIASADRKYHRVFTGDGTTSGRRTWTFTHVGDTGEYQIRVNGYNAVAKFWDFKIESGNIPTDWTPAPEDTETEISSVTTRVTNAETNIEQNNKELLLRATTEEVKKTVTSATNGLVTKEMLDTYKKENSAQLSVLADKVAVEVAETVRDEVKTGDDALWAVYNELRMYYTFGTDGQYIGKEGSDARLHLINDLIEILVGGAAAMKLDRDGLTAPQANVKTLHMGDYTLALGTDGHLTLT